MGVCRYPPPHVIPVKITRRINTRVSKLRSRQGRKPGLKISCNRLHVRGTLHRVERKDQKMTCRIKPPLRIPEAVESPRARSTRSRLQQRACSLACGTIGQESCPSPGNPSASFRGSHPAGVACDRTGRVSSGSQRRESVDRYSAFGQANRQHTSTLPQG